MKLFEIIDTAVSDKTSTTGTWKNQHQKYMNYRANNAPDKSGGYGRVHDDSTDPHMVHKLNHRAQPLYSDGYVAYIDFIVRDKVAERNPFAPRVYSTRTVADAEGMGRYKYKMERLVKASDLNVEQLDAVTHSLFDEESISDALDAAYPKNDKLDTLTILMHGLFYNNQSKNNNLDKLVEIIKEIRHGGGFGLDMHSGNYMFRLGKGIPQLVITDPLA